MPTAGTVGRFDQYIAASPPGCSVENWECIREHLLHLSSTRILTDAIAASYNAKGFEIGLHVTHRLRRLDPVLAGELLR